MASQQELDENRKSFRCGVPSSRQKAVLELGSAELPVQLQDESAGGFAALVEGPPGVAVDDVIRLRTDTGYFEVRVTNVTEVEREAEEKPAEGNRPQPRFRVGLLRLKELDPPDAKQGRFGGFGWRFRLAQTMPASSSMVVLGLVFGWLVVMGALVATVSTVYMAREVSSPGSIFNAKLSKLVGPGSRTRQGMESTRESATESESIRDAAGTALRQEVDELAELSRSIRRLSGAAPFSLPPVIDELELTDQQQKQMNRLVEDTMFLLQDVYQQRPVASRGARSADRLLVLQNARQRALELLTAEQRRRWQKLVDAGG